METLMDVVTKVWGPPYSHLELGLTGLVFAFFVFLRQLY